jgi:hypothetical protein
MDPTWLRRSPRTTLPRLLGEGGRRRRFVSYTHRDPEITPQPGAACLGLKRLRLASGFRLALGRAVYINEKSAFDLL